MSRRALTFGVGGALLVALLVLGAGLRVPYVALGPGPTENTLATYRDVPLIQIEGRRTYPTDGNLNLTTVRVSRSLLLGDALRLWLDHRYAVVPRELIYPPGKSNEQVNQENVQLMKESQDQAKTAALRELGIPVTIHTVVESITPTSKANGVLRKGDVITAVDGTKVSDGDQLRELVQAHDPGEPVALTYERDGSTATATIVTTKGDDGSAAVGILLREAADYPFTVRIMLEEQIGGSSAGLMFALGIVDKLTPGSMTGGRFIAGTGEIDSDGNVGPIGGIQQKLVAAREAGATVFLTPEANCEQASRAIPDGLRLIKVKTLDDAVSSLDALREGRGNVPSCSAG